MKITLNKGAAAAKPPGGYPYDTLSRAIKLGAAVRDHGGREVQKSMIAKALQMADASSAFYQITASAKTFGIIEGAQRLSLTEHGKEFFHPTELGNEQRARLMFFASPPVFRKMIDRYDGQRLPPQEILTNVMVSEGVPQSWASRTAAAFVNTANDVGVLDEAGYLRYDAAIHGHRRELRSTEVALPPTPVRIDPTRPEVIVPRATSLSDSQLISGKSNTWVFREEGGEVRLETSDPLPFSLWERLEKYVQILKPSE